MRRFDTILNFFGIAVILLSVSLFMVNDSARGSCATIIAKEAEGAGDTLFSFTTTVPEVADFSIVDGDTHHFLFNGSGEFTVLEDPSPGWALGSVECTTETEVPFEVIDGGVRIDCQSGMRDIQCTFVNVRAQVESNIPALSGWGMIAAAGGLIIAGVYFALRRRRASGAV